MQKLINDLCGREGQLKELRSSFENLESFPDVNPLAFVLKTALSQLENELTTAKSQAKDRIKTLQVQPKEKKPKQKHKTYLELIISSSFIYHLFANVLLLKVLAKLGNYALTKIITE